MNVILSNISSLLATLTDMFSSSRKKARDLLLVQCIGQLFYGISTLLVKGYSAAVQNAICIARNITAASKVKSKLLEWMFFILATGLGLLMAYLGKDTTAIWVGILPILANLEYTLAIFRFKDRIVPIKIAFAIHAGLYAVYDLMLQIYTGAICNFILIIITVVFVINNQRNNK